MLDYLLKVEISLLHDNHYFYPSEDINADRRVL